MEDFREEIKGKVKREQIQKEQKKAGRLSFGDEDNGMVRGAGMGISKKQFQRRQVPPLFIFTGKPMKQNRKMLLWRGHTGQS